MSKICLCMTASTLRRNLEILDKYRKFADMAELRVDCLDPDERFLVRRFPEQAGMPVILTIRRDIDGGKYVGGEGARVNLMAKGLAFAETDRRRNFAYLDIEQDLDVPSLEEAARTFGTRIIRSYHNINGTDTDLPQKLRSMLHYGDEIVKASVTANCTKDMLTLLHAGREIKEQEKILIGMGHYGIYSRILAEQFGSFLSYTSALCETDAPPAAPGQIEVQELSNLYHLRSITKDTKIFGIIGNPLKASGSPYFFNTIFELEGSDAVYVPFPADSIVDIMEIVRELDVRGLSVTVPYKETILPFLDDLSGDVKSIGACNTLSRITGNTSDLEDIISNSEGWLGTNTDAQGFSDSLLAFMNKQNLKRKRVTVIGAGGAARAVVFELHRLGAKVLILNRTAHKARRLAVPYKFDWGGLDDHDIEKIEKYRDIIIQTTSVGMEGIDNGDPLPMYSFNGKELVMDLIYKPKRTPFLARASNAGCDVLNGYDMLTRQARYQYTQFTGKEFPEHFISRVQYGES